MRQKVVIIESASENGAGKRGASLGPSALLLEAREQGITIFDNLEWIESTNFNDFYNPDNENQHAKNAKSVYKALNALAKNTEKVISEGNFPLILTGDHSNAIGSISGLKNAYPNKRIGVMWIDAHYDLHSPYTSPSGNIHGMSLNALIADDNKEEQVNDVSAADADYWEKMKYLGSNKICPKIDPNDLVFIQVRDYEKPEEHLINKYGITTYSPEEVDEKGVDIVIDEALNKLANCDLIYVSFDVDYQDTSISVGTGTPVPNGLDEADATIIFKRLFAHPKVAAFEITEINPILDTNNKMAKAVLKLLNEVL